jgi:hypothetical protein
MAISYINGTINTAVTGSSVVIPIAAAGTFGIDLNLSAATATGVIYVYVQNDNPATSTFFGEPALSIAVNSGVFLGDFTKFHFSTTDVPFGVNLNIVWTTAGTPAGSIAVSALLNNA